MPFCLAITAAKVTQHGWLRLDIIYLLQLCCEVMVKWHVAQGRLQAYPGSQIAIYYFLGIESEIVGCI